MANFDVLARRAAAEGYSFQSLKSEVIRLMAASQAKWEAEATGGFSSPMEFLTSERLATDIANSEYYGGGYMYSHDNWELEGYGSLREFYAKHSSNGSLREFYAKHSSNGSLREFYAKHTSSGPNRWDERVYSPEPVLELLNAAPAGTRLTWQWSADKKQEERFLKTKDGSWCFFFAFYENVAIWEKSCDARLYSGIREDAAKALGVGLSLTFHRLFDQAVEEVKYG